MPREPIPASYPGNITGDSCHALREHLGCAPSALRSELDDLGREPRRKHEREVSPRRIRRPATRCRARVSHTFCVVVSGVDDHVLAVRVDPRLGAISAASRRASSGDEYPASACATYIDEAIGRFSRLAHEQNLAGRVNYAIRELTRQDA